MRTLKRLKRLRKEFSCVRCLYNIISKYKKIFTKKQKNYHYFIHIIDMKEKYILEGVFTQFDPVNRNGPRIYDYDIFLNQIEALKARKKRERRNTRINIILE